MRRLDDHRDAAACLRLQDCAMQHDPAAVVGEKDAGPIFGIASFAEDEIVGLGIGAEFVKEDVTVIHLLPGGNVSLLRISRVVEAGVVVQPGNGSRTRALDGVGKNCSALRLDNVQRRHL